MISCVCITHGRAHIIGEAVESYLRQDDCGVETEMLIYNDCPEQPLVCNAPGVRVVNLSEPIRDVSLKFNAAVSDARGNLVAWWEDDDISLPWRLADSYRMMRAGGGTARYYKHSHAWCWNNGELTEFRSNLFFGSGMFERELFMECGGANAGDWADKTAHDNMVRGCGAGEFVEAEPQMEQAFFVYRWAGAGVHHDSGVAGSNSDRFAAFRARTLANPLFRAGVQTIRPGWKQDYVAMVFDKMGGRA